MARLLFLTSPQLRGPDVLAAQRLLYRHGFKPGPLDGVYGPATAAATRRAQRHYSLRVDGIYGPATKERLSGPPAPAPPAHPGREPAGLLALAWLETRIGMKEAPPDSNACPITHEFGIGRVPWCMEAVSLAFKHGANVILGDTLPHPWGYWEGRGFAYVPAFEAWAKTRGFWIGRTSPEHGDVVCFDWGGDGVADHVGIVKKYLGGGQFETVEGNTAVGNDSNGGEVMERHRYVSQVVGFARVTLRQP